MLAARRVRQLSSPPGAQTVIFYTCPVLTALLAWLLLGERFTWLMAVGCGASLAGVVLVAQASRLCPLLVAAPVAA